MDFPSSTMLPTPEGGLKFDDLFGPPTSPAAIIFKDPACRKRSVSSPIQSSIEPADKGNYNIKYYQAGNNVFTPGKPMTLAPTPIEQDLSESTATPSSDSRTLPSNNGAASTALSTCGSALPTEATDQKKEDVCEVIKDHSSSIVPPMKVIPDHKRSPSKDLTQEVEKKRDQKIPETGLLQVDTLCGVTPGDPRVNNAHKEPTTLTTIPEDKVPAMVCPTVVTVELAAAAKIFLETYYNEILRGPTPRALRTHHLESQLYGARHLSAEGKQCYLEAFYRAESNHLRETRVLKARSTRSLLFDEGSGGAMLRATMCASDFEMLKTIGKGSFGTVRLVREKTLPQDDSTVVREKKKQVYAMKVIRKSEMIRSGQEGHMRAERDFLVSSEGSNWAVPLVASFQDVANLYLVMEYMPGGDFLGLLIRENILDEAVTRFYIAEMILAIEEAHALKYIHRDIKPDNFLISASGHLKISDFGLAFDGHWSHDSRYYSSTRYSLLQNLGIYVPGDELDQKKDESLGTPGAMVCNSSMMASLEKHQRLPDADDKEPILQWRNRCGNHMAATSVVGTSQYMAPEVIRGESYDGRCDWWSIGVIFYECLYGRTPFLSEQGRNETKKNILNHEAVFGLPSWPPVSRRCQQLLISLVTDKSRRLCSKRYQLKDAAIAELAKIADGGHIPSKDSFSLAASRSMARQYVFPFDAEDIKAHKFFKGVPWERLHQMPPPFIPKIRSDDDTQYFDDGNMFDDDDDSTELPSTWCTDKDGGKAKDASKGNIAAPEQMKNAAGCMDKGLAVQNQQLDREDSMDEALDAFDVTVQMKALGWISTPYDSSRLKMIEAEIGQLIALGMPASDGEALLRFVEKYGKREKKRARDRLLRDRKTMHISMELRKRNAFLGYTWRRMGPYKAMLRHNRGVEASLAVMRSSHRGCF